MFLDSRFSDRRKIEIIDVKNDSVVKIMTKNENEFECWTCQPPFFSASHTSKTSSKWTVMKIYHKEVIHKQYVCASNVSALRTEHEFK